MPNKNKHFNEQKDHFSNYYPPKPEFRVTKDIIKVLMVLNKMIQHVVGYIGEHFPSSQVIS
jgi:hypothetical protein